MNNFLRLFSVFLWVGISLPGHASSPDSTESKAIHFFQGSLSQLELKARTENKPYIVFFYTDWCEPCQALRSETLNTERISRYLNEHYLTFKINADISTRGEEALADKFSVELFPTILIFGSSGELMDQFYGFKDSGELLDDLQTYYQINQKEEPEEQELVYVPVYEHVEESAYQSSHEARTLSESQPTYMDLPINSTSSKSLSGPKWDESESIPSTSKFISQATKAPKASPSLSLPRGDGLFQMQIHRHDSDGYAVQVGVFKEYQNAIFKMEQSSLYSERDMLMNVNSLNNEPVFKVMFGPFDSKNAARSFMMEYQQETQEAAILVDLSWFR